ncbi:hydroxyacylglutathione hydrolase [Ideonella sp. 4Y11]|uniref:Hydroxyacylglutathione hydrolase n=1 Tax=Ideonella aquatica TaxID=2824119 RepID=A0A941BKL9_9BURK|nr:hydroxyacylglutathione hydrolase [Ideonella aquatica]MBQ0958739.1 hydroxyacylglutathione hydrolase [Ideonella aquatica]
MELLALPAFADNYVWMLIQGTQALVVDPGDASPVLQALAQRGLTLGGILVTHHHGDHVDGLDALRPHLQGPIWGPEDRCLTGQVQPVHDGDTLQFADLPVTVIGVPGHTSTHLAFAVAAEPPLLFCGDTLFSAGCGRLFEGTAVQMHASLQRLLSLPAGTLVCCAHEYTLANLRFALAADPDNTALQTHLRWVESTRADGLPSLPTTLALECQINPFLRCDQPALVASAMAHGAASDRPVDVFAALRAWKNDFR